MKWEGCAASRGSSSFTDEERAAGVGAGGGAEGIDEAEVGTDFEGNSADNIEAVGGVWDVLNPSADGSTCCAVELKYRARFGRRKVGGSTTGGIHVSRMDFLKVLLNILILTVLHLCFNAGLKVSSRDNFQFGNHQDQQGSKLWMTQRTP